MGGISGRLPQSMPVHSNQALIRGKTQFDTPDAALNAGRSWAENTEGQQYTAAVSYGGYWHAVQEDTKGRSYGQFYQSVQNEYVNGTARDNTEQAR